MTSRRHFDNIFDSGNAYEDEDDEHITILQRNGVYTKKPRRKALKTLLIVFVVLAVLLVITAGTLVLAWLMLGSWAFDRIFLVGPDNLAQECTHNKYDDFTTWGGCPGLTEPHALNFARYVVPMPFLDTNVSFPSRDPFWISQGATATIRATFYSFDNMTTRPTIIVVHGYKDCRMATSSLLASGMLWHNGYNVLNIDLRNHGKSDCYAFQKAYTTFGSEEHKDVLGAYDYLVERYRNMTMTQGTPVIGLYGASMGATTSIIAFSALTNVTAAFIDSPPCDVYGTIANIVSGEYKVNPPFVLTSSCATAKLESRYGCPPFENDPLAACEKLANRRVHIEWTKGDLVVPIWNLENNCLPILKRVGANVTVNIMESSRNTAFGGCDDHIYNQLLNTTGYENRLISFFNENLY